MHLLFLVVLLLGLLRKFAKFVAAFSLFHVSGVKVVEN